ncbi:hypothetical protein [Blastococcus litoris]|uniref:hypothetical protein n=1 Tax=Blastococcus litoris TaxID=2171622 RepID=UPI0013DFE6F3|nr:hypothetical protein [Blastococcus litoris]
MTTRAIGRPELLLGAAGTAGAVTAAVLDRWVLALVVLLGSTVAELLVVLVRRGRSGRV